MRRGPDRVELRPETFALFNLQRVHAIAPGTLDKGVKLQRCFCELASSAHAAAQRIGRSAAPRALTVKRRGA